MKAMKKLSSLFLVGVLSFALSASAFAASQPDYTISEKSNNDPFMTLTETGSDGKIVTYSYDLEDLNCTIVDETGNEVYTGPVKDDTTSRIAIGSCDIKTGYTMYWFPKDNKDGFYTAKAGTAVTLSFKTSKALSKTIGLTNGGGSSSSTEKNPSAILYTGAAGRWKAYMQNDSSETIHVKSGSVTWGV